MKSIPSNIRPWLLPIIIMASAILFQSSGQPGFDTLRYNRELIFSGQWWRFFTGHLIHLSWMHLFMNMSGLVLLNVLFKNIFSPLQWFALILVSMSGIDLGLIIFNPEIAWYVGFSGVLHGIIAVVSLMLILNHGVKGAGILILLLLKLIWEQLSGPLPGTEDWTGGAVITEAHLYGAISGGIFFIFRAVPSSIWGERPGRGGK